jgi:Zn-finger nucleic acid-binding protein
MTRVCPDCNVDMSQLSFELSRIRSTAGDRAFDELDAIVQPDAGHEAVPENMHRKCPACMAAMRRFRYMYTSPVFLDSCDACGGVWIENGELQQMREYLRAAKSGQEPPIVHDHANTTVGAMGLSPAERVRANKARAAASMIAYHRD